MTNTSADIVVLSDDDDDDQVPMTTIPSPLTMVKSKSSLKKRKSISGKITKPTHMKKGAQTTIGQFFNKVGVHTKQSPSKLFTSTTAFPEDMYENVRLSPLKVSCSVKRSSLGELDVGVPLKIRRTSQKIYNLKGKDLLNAFAPRSLKEKTPEKFEEKKEPTEDLLEQAFRPICHFHINEKSVDVKPKSRSITPELLKERQITPPLETNNGAGTVPLPVIKPMASLTLKKRKSKDKLADPGPLLCSTQYQPDASTPKKSNKSDGELFSDDSFQMMFSKSFEEERASLCSEYGRHTILTYHEGVTNTILRVIDTKGYEKTCELRGFWAEIPMKAGDVVNIFGQFDSNGYILVDMKQNLIVVSPDFLVSGSVIASATACVRRGVLNNRYKGYDAGNKYMLLGSILHEIFQKVLVLKITDEQAMRKLAQEVAHTASYAHHMYAIGMAEKNLLDSIDEYIPPMANFLKKHVGFNAKDDLKITEIQDIEETVWSPRYGMKGKIDATIACQKKNGTHSVPLELKTGKPTYSAEHKGQVTMYSMMLAEKQGHGAMREKMEPGLLVYLKDGSMQEVTSSEAAVKGLVQLRNELCHGLLLGIEKTPEGEVKVQPLPEPIDQERMCGTCPHNLTCSLHQRVFNDFIAPSGHMMERLVPQTLDHLDSITLEYFTKWSKMMLLEADEEAKWKTVSDIWCKPLNARISQGTCLAGLLIERVEEKYSNFLHYLRVDAGTMLEHPKLLAHTKLKKGDNTVVNEEGSHIVAMATGAIIEITGCGITLLLDRKLNSNKKLTVDLYDYYNSGGIGFTNLARLMENTPESSRLRDSLIARKPPAFEEVMKSGVVALIKPIMKQMNKIQRQVLLKVLLSKDFTVIKGYPGTGKTSTIVALVKALRCLGLSILLTSYTHSAVDNILLKLKQENVEFLRIGRVSRIHKELQEHSADYLTQSMKTVDQISEFYAGHHVVAVTCLGVNHGMFARRNFDVCIVDEASQIMQPTILGPLFQAKRFVVVGDSHQLPPLIKSTEAKSLGMEETLIDLLENSGACLELTLQYRMNSEIMRLCNALVYDNKLQCGTEEVQSACIQPKTELPSLNHNWEKKAMSESLVDSVVMLDVAEVGGIGSNVQSDVEAAVVMKICQDFIKAGILCENIGVITPYQAQVQLLRKTLGNDLVEVNTVDQYQGRDKHVIIISFVRSSTSAINKGEGILSDMKRLNVAITRAKHKMILIGHVPALQVYKPVKALIDCLRENQILKLSKDWKT